MAPPMSTCPKIAARASWRLACQLLGRIVQLRRQERRSAEVRRELSAAAMTDPLTGLPNRRAWDAALAQRMATAADSAELLCLAVLDLDRFKRLNDTLGHPAGDEALRLTGRVIARSVRQSDFAARLGGEEFGLLLWVPDAAAAATVVRRVQARVSAALGSLPPPKVTASAGYAIASAAAGTDSAQALFLAADSRLAGGQTGRAKPDHRRLGIWGFGDF